MPSAVKRIVVSYLPGRAVSLRGAEHEPDHVAAARGDVEGIRGPEPLRETSPGCSLRVTPVRTLAYSATRGTMVTDLHPPESLTGAAETRTFLQLAPVGENAELQRLKLIAEHADTQRDGGLAGLRSAPGLDEVHPVAAIGHQRTAGPRGRKHRGLRRRRLLAGRITARRCSRATQARVSALYCCSSPGRGAHQPESARLQRAGGSVSRRKRTVCDGSYAKRKSAESRNARLFPLAVARCRRSGAVSEYGVGGSQSAVDFGAGGTKEIVEKLELEDGRFAAGGPVAGPPGGRFEHAGLPGRECPRICLPASRRIASRVSGANGARQLLRRERQRRCGGQGSGASQFAPASLPFDCRWPSGRAARSACSCRRAP